MLYWALVFFMTAILAGVLGLENIAIISAEIAQVFFYVFLFGFILSIILHFIGKGGKSSSN